MAVEDRLVDFVVVLNDEEQYSIWPEGEALPAGWYASGYQGSKEACLNHIKDVWTDMRPKSLRLAMEPQCSSG
jgi:MbtH protein